MYRCAATSVFLNSLCFYAVWFSLQIFGVFSHIWCAQLLEPCGCRSVLFFMIIDDSLQSSVTNKPSVLTSLSLLLSLSHTLSPPDQQCSGTWRVSWQGFGSLGAGTSRTKTSLTGVYQNHFSLFSSFKSLTISSLLCYALQYQLSFSSSSSSSSPPSFSFSPLPPCFLVFFSPPSPC